MNAAHEIRITKWQEKKGFYEAQAFSLSVDAWDQDRVSRLVVIPHEMGGWKWTVTGSSGIEGIGRCDTDDEARAAATKCVHHMLQN
jgi:hypothetical protein